MTELLVIVAVMLMATAVQATEYIMVGDDLIVAPAPGEDIPGAATRDPATGECKFAGIGLSSDLGVRMDSDSCRAWVDSDRTGLQATPPQTAERDAEVRQSMQESHDREKAMMAAHPFPLEPSKRRDGQPWGRRGNSNQAPMDLFLTPVPPAANP